MKKPPQGGFLFDLRIYLQIHYSHIPTRLLARLQFWHFSLKICTFAFIFLNASVVLRSNKPIKEFAVKYKNILFRLSTHGLQCIDISELKPFLVEGVDPEILRRIDGILRFKVNLLLQSHAEADELRDAHRKMRRLVRPSLAKTAEFLYWTTRWRGYADILKMRLHSLAFVPTPDTGPINVWNLHDICEVVRAQPGITKGQVYKQFDLNPETDDWKLAVLIGNQFLIAREEEEILRLYPAPRYLKHIRHRDTPSDDTNA